MNKIETYITGSGDKPKIDKTMKDWISEFFTSFFRTKKSISIFIALYGGSFVLNYFPQWGIAVHPSIIVAQIMAAVLFAPIVFVMIVVVIVRIVGLSASLAHPEIKAEAIEVFETKITISCSNEEKKTFNVEDILRLIVMYNFRGVYVHTSQMYQTYILPLEPKELEQKLDMLQSLTKEVGSLESKEGNVRVVYYTNPKFPDKKLQSVILDK